MVCSLCGKSLIDSREKEKMEEEAQWRLNLREEMERMYCDELYVEFLTSSVYHRYDLAKTILKERGHTEI